MTRIAQLIAILAVFGMLYSLSTGDLESNTASQMSVDPVKKERIQVVGAEAESHLKTAHLSETKTQKSTGLATVIPARVPLADEVNGYLVLTQATELINIPEDIDIRAMSLEPKLKDIARLREVLAANADALSLLKKAVALGQGQVPEIKSFDHELPELTGFLALGDLLRAQTIVDLADGLLDSAVENVVLQEKFGRLILQSEGVLVQSLVGLTVMGEGRRSKEDILELDRFTRDKLELYSDLLRPEPRTAEIISLAWKASLQSEARMAHSEFDRIKKEGIPDYYWSMMGPIAKSLPKVMRATMGSPIGLKTLYNAEETKSLYDSLMAQGLLSVELASQEQAQKIFDDVDKDVNDKLKMAIAEIGTPGAKSNPVGRMLISQLMPSLAGIRKQMATAQMTELMQSIRVAVNLHEGLYSKAPNSLEELVPHFLEANPKDPWTGGKVHYDKDKRLVWFGRGEPGSDKELVFKLK